MPLAAPKNQARRRAPAAGFTLIEVLVSLTLALVIVWLIYTLFSSTSTTVRISLARSTVFQNAYTAETRLRMDFTSMIGPKRTSDNAAGALMVIPAMREGRLPMPGHPEGRIMKKLRSDQLVLFYDAKHGGVLYDTGAGTAIKSQTQAGTRSYQAKIWLGHVQVAGGDSPLATQWTLGRQATLLSSPNAVVRAGVPAPFPANASAGGLDSSTVLSPASHLNLTTDVAEYSLEEVANWMRALGKQTDDTDQAMMRAFAVQPNDNAHYTNQPEVETQPLRDNALTASDLFAGARVFLSNCSEIYVQYSTDNRPGDDASGLPNAQNGLIDTDGATDGDYSGNIAWSPSDLDVFDPMRPGHAEAIKPAVFYPGDDQQRVWHVGYYQGPAVQGTANPTRIFAYPPSASDPTKPDYEKPPLYAQNKFGDWTPYPAVNGLQFGDAIADAAAYADAMRIYADHHLKDDGGSCSPRDYHGPPARPLSPSPPPWDANHLAPWQQPQSKWPQLVRIRYRLHDAQNLVYSQNDDLLTNRRDDDADGTPDNDEESRCSGLWFEHIFAIPYPRPQK